MNRLTMDFSSIRGIVYSLSLFLSLTALSQKMLSVSGKVTNAETGDPLPFATVGVKGSSYGTISNSEGKFEFFIPSTYSHDTLSISYVGHETYKEVVGQIKNPLNITLEESIIVLEEVEVNIAQLTGKQIIQKALDKIEDNFPTDPFTMKGFFRDIRKQNEETVYLVEASLDIYDLGVSVPRKFYINAARASDSRINPLLSGSLLNSGNSLIVNLERNYWLNWLKYNINKSDFKIEDIILKDDEPYYSITTTEEVSKADLAVGHKDLKYNLTHKYLIHCETYAIHKVQHLESSIKGKYVGIEPPYEGDTLFYCKKGWNQTMVFGKYQGKMFLKYHDVSYAFDIVDKKNNIIYLDMIYQFDFIVTHIETTNAKKPTGGKMSRNRPLALQTKEYEPSFWEDPSNAKLVPLTQKQIHDLEKDRPLEEQFRARKTKSNKNLK